MFRDDPLGNTSKISAPAAQVAVAAAAATLLLLASLHVLSPEFDPSWRMVSEYANGQYGWALSLMFAAWAASSLALVVAIRSQVNTRAGRIGLGFLVAAGVGEAMASVFDLRHPLHDVAGLLGLGGLPIAAMLMSRSLGRSAPWTFARSALLRTANLTCISLVLLIAAFVIVVVTFVQSGGDMSANVEITVLPPGVIGLVGVANRLLIGAYCLWVLTVAWLAIKLRGHESGAFSPLRGLALKR